MARIQGFEDFIFPVSKTQTIKQMKRIKNITIEPQRRWYEI